MSRSTLQSLDENGGTTIFENTLLQVWRGTATAEAIARTNQIARSLIEDSPGSVTCLYLVESTSPPPLELARKQLVVFSRELASQMALAVIVAEGGGFRAALVRGVGIALSTMMPHRVPFKFVNGVEEALALLGPHLPKAGGGVAGLRDALSELRHAVAAKVPRVT